MDRITTSCAACGHPVTIRLCERCRANTDADLVALPGLYRSLADVLAPGVGAGDRVSGSRTPPLPVRLGPLTLRSGGSVASILTSWEDDWREILGWTMRPFRGNNEQTLEGTVKFLRSNWPWAIDKHPAPQEFAWEVRDLTSACRTEIEGKGESRVIGTCPSTDESGRICGAKLWASPYATEIRCRLCRAAWKQDEWLSLAMSIRA